MRILTLAIFVLTSITSYAQWTTGGSSIYYLGGNVGIGTSSPIGTLHINSTSSSGLRVQNVTGGLGNTAGIDFSTASGTGRMARIDAIDQGNHNGDLAFYTDGDNTNNSNVIERMRITRQGFIGIGTIAPASKLHIDGGTVSFGPYAGALASIGRVSISGTGGELSLLSRTSTSFVETPTNGERWSIYNYDNGSLRFWSGNDKMALSYDGNLSIGATNAQGYKLAVAGKAIAEEINVKLQANWPDYVFEKDYSLPSLESVQTYIDQNKHLPEVPSAKEMEANGINLSEMNILLLKKVEELTLYVIEQQRQIQLQNSNIDRLVSEIDSLKLKTKSQ